MSQLSDKQISAAIAEARSWLGTPWKHNQRTKGLGVDCVQLLWASGAAAGLSIPPLGNYYSMPNGDSLKEELLKYGDEIGYGDAIAEPGCIVLYRFSGIPHHVGLITDPYHMIHASLQFRAVVEHRVDSFWHNRAVCGIRWRDK